MDQPYEQAKRCLEIIADALAELDATMADVTRTRMFVTDIERWAEHGRAQMSMARCGHLGVLRRPQCGTVLNRCVLGAVP